MAEFKAAQLSNFLKKPDKKIRVFLVYGQDEGLVRERSKALCLTAVDSLDDPFCYSEIAAGDLSDDPARLMDEVTAISMMGGERVVRIRGAGNTHTNLLKPALDADLSNTLIVIEAGDLKKTASLVKLVSGASFGVIIACYKDKAQDITALIREVLGNAGLSANTDAVEYLRQNLGGDRALSRQELDKLVLYKGDDTTPITLDDVRTMIGDSSAENVFDVIDAALLGNIPLLEKSLNKAFFSGESPIAFLRMIQNQLKQLHKAALFMDRGVSSSEAIKKAGIPFFNQQKATMQLSGKNAAHMATSLSITLEAEMACKTTGYPAETICRRALLRIAMANRRR
ncbi:DNA polymerase III subunit delta [Sneathiella chinensis]|uniref:DNA-directed DNA polymerase n=1 Tax=Sneathiella chinensis TaxID=349750 RepID=A0ABQ5TZU2_9PROT|nr:DNA polymerase III subunit delta [Sneathiella chinensis]GLQ04951.1 DNA polymerase III subunit delta [Sneathiella chinensis]